MEKNPHIDKAITLMGGPVLAAKKLGIANYQTVQQWSMSGNIPGKYARRVEDLTGVSRSLTCKQWSDLWPELSEAHEPKRKRLRSRPDAARDSEGAEASSYGAALMTGGV